LARRDPAQALTIIEALIRSAPNIETQGEHAIPRLTRLLGEALAALGQSAAAEELLKAACDSAKDILAMLWRAQASLARFYQSQRRRDEAEAVSAEAHAVISTLAASIPDASLRDNFAQRATAHLPALPPPTPLRAAKQAAAGLTAREREVATLIAQGKSNRAIADALVLSERTVAKHVENVMSKLGFSSRAQVAAWAVEKGLMK
jgi:DNA-binding NarL/FixJ family response regulator